MFHFGETSKINLMTCHPNIQAVFFEAIEGYDCSVICGWRGKDLQNYLFRSNLSEKEWPNSKHNNMSEGGVLSLAADVVPYPVDWKNTKRFYHFGGYVKGIARNLGIRIVWGGDWDSDNDLDDQKFFDLGHFELVL